MENDELGGKLYVLIKSRVGSKYHLGIPDIDWIEFVATFWDGLPNNKSILRAFRKAALRVRQIDPYELAIDAGICNPKLKPMSDEKFCQNCGAKPSIVNNQETTA